MEKGGCLIVLLLEYPCDLRMTWMIDGRRMIIMRLTFVPISCSNITYVLD